MCILIYNIFYKKIFNIEDKLKWETNLNIKGIQKLNGESLKLIKDIDLNQFYKKFKELKPNDKLPNKDFLIWLIGFFEGDGSFVMSKRGDLKIRITQGFKDKEILELIKNNLNMGGININSKKNQTYNWDVYKRRDIYLLCLLLNGNIVLPTRWIKFGIFLNKLNEFLLKNNEEIILLKNELLLPSLENSWLSGFMDSKGSFIIEKNLRIKYILSQKYLVNKYVLDYILELFNNLQGDIIGVVNEDSKKGENYVLCINELKNVVIIFDYFNKYPLKKKDNILKFKEVFNLLKK